VPQMATPALAPGPAAVVGQPPVPATLPATLPATPTIRRVPLNPAPVVQRTQPFVRTPATPVTPTPLEQAAPLEQPALQVPDVNVKLPAQKKRFIAPLPPPAGGAPAPAVQGNSVAAPVLTPAPASPPPLPLPVTPVPAPIPAPPISAKPASEAA